MAPFQLRVRTLYPRTQPVPFTPLSIRLGPPPPSDVHPGEVRTQHVGSSRRPLSPELRAGSPLQRVDRGLRLGTAHRSAAVPAHSPRPHPGDERRELPAQVQPGERPAPSSRRSRRRINRTLDAFSSCSCNVAALPDLLPSVTSQRVHFCSALLAPHPGALDTSARIRGLSARGRAFSALGGLEAKRS